MGERLVSFNYKYVIKLEIFFFPLRYFFSPLRYISPPLLYMNPDLKISSTWPCTVVIVSLFSGPYSDPTLISFPRSSSKLWKLSSCKLFLNEQLIRVPTTQTSWLSPTHRGGCTTHEWRRLSQPPFTTPARVSWCGRLSTVFTLAKVLRSACVYSRPSCATASLTTSSRWCHTRFEK